MRPDRAFFLMVQHPARGWIRVGAAYATRADAASWQGFVRGAWRGCPVKISTLRLRYLPDGSLTPATLRILNEKYNLDAPLVERGSRPSTGGEGKP